MAHRSSSVVSWIAFTTLAAGFATGQEFGKLREALGDNQISESWIYEDIQVGYAEAQKTGKPLLVAFR